MRRKLQQTYRGTGGDGRRRRRYFLRVEGEGGGNTTVAGEAEGANRSLCKRSCGAGWAASTAATVVVASVAMWGGRGRWRLGCMGKGKEYGGHNKQTRQPGPERRQKVALRVAWRCEPVRVVRRRKPLKLCLPRAPTLVDFRGRARGTAVYMKHGRNILVNSYECQGKAWRWQTCRATRLHANTRKSAPGPVRRAGHAARTVNQTFEAA